MAAETIELGWRVGRVTARAVGYFGDLVRMLEWLTKPSVRFRGAYPVSRCGTE